MEIKENQEAKRTTKILDFTSHKLLDSFDKPDELNIIENSFIKPDYFHQVNEDGEEHQPNNDYVNDIDTSIAY